MTKIFNQMFELIEILMSHYKYCMLHLWDKDTNYIGY